MEHLSKWVAKTEVKSSGFISYFYNSSMEGVLFVPKLRQSLSVAENVAELSSMTNT